MILQTDKPEGVRRQVPSFRILGATWTGVCIFCVLAGTVLLYRGQLEKNQFLSARLDAQAKLLQEAAK